MLAVAVPASAAVPLRVAPLPEGTPCRADRLLEQSLARQPMVALSRGEALTVEFTPPGAGEARWRLELRRPGGGVELSRELEGARECGDVSFAAALIIERYLREVELPKLASAAQAPDAGRPRLSASGQAPSAVAPARAGADQATPRRETVAVRDPAAGAVRAAPGTSVVREPPVRQAKKRRDGAAVGDAPGGAAREAQERRDGGAELGGAAGEAQARRETSPSSATPEVQGRRDLGTGPGGAAGEAQPRREADAAGETSPARAAREVQERRDGGAELGGAAGEAQPRREAGAARETPPGSAAREVQERRDGGAELGGAAGEAQARRETSPSSAAPEVQGRRDGGAELGGAAGEAQARRETSPSSAAREAGAARETSPGTAAPEVQGRPDLGAGPGGAADAAQVAAAGPNRPAGVAGRLTRFELSAGAAAWVPAPTVVRPSLVLDAALHLAPGWRLALVGALSFEERHPVTVDGVARGTLTTQAFLAEASGARCAGTTWRFCGALLAGVRFAHGASQGDFLFHTLSTWLARPSFGLAASLAVIPLRALVVSLDLTGLLNPVPAEFSVQGIPSASQPFPLVEGLLRLSVGWGVDL